MCFPLRITHSAEMLPYARSLLGSFDAAERVSLCGWLAYNRSATARINLELVFPQN